MAGSQKHAERSHRSYRQKMANIGGHYSRNLQKQAVKQAVKSGKNGGFLSRIFGRSKKEK